MATKMKALVKKYAKEGLWLEEVDVPTIGDFDVLIKMKKTAICGTDVHIYNWDEWSQATIPVPMTVGHEFVGEIVEIGKGVTDFKVGDLVSGEGHIVCGHCRNCLAGRRHLCKNTLGVGVNRTGIFAEYAAIPESNVWLCDPSIPEEVLSIFDPLGNAAHTALSFDLLGEDVLITGAGPIGIMAAAIAKHAGARHIVVTDVNDYRLGLAEKLGATRTVNPMREKLQDVMVDLNMKEGFDVGLEMSGNASAFNDMVDCMFHGGKIAMLGIQGPETRVDWNKVVFNGLWIKGIYGREMYETWYKVQAMLQSGLDISGVITHSFHYTEFEKGFDIMRSVDISGVITHSFHYTEFEKGFDIMRSGQSGKVILEW